MQTLLLTAPFQETTMPARLLEAMGFRVASHQTYRSRPDECGRSFRWLANEVNDALLELLQSNWYHVTNITPALPTIALTDRTKKGQRDSVKELDRHTPWVLHDSAMCLLLPLWMEYLTRPVYILYAQHPQAYAESLQKIWRFPIVFGAALWEFYMRAAIKNTRGLPRLVLCEHELVKRPIEYVEYVYRSLSRKGNQCLSTPCRNSINRLVASRDECLEQNAETGREFLNNEQSALYAALQTEDMDQPELETMSKTGVDILKAYGRLRAGYETIKQERNEITSKFEALSPSTTDEFFEPSSANSVEAEYADENPPDNINVTLHLRDMQPLELICQRDNPVLKQLFDALVKKTDEKPGGQEIFHLQLVDQNLYFPLSELQGIETNPGLAAEWPNQRSGDAIQSNTSAEFAKIIFHGPKYKSVAVVVLGCMLPQYDFAIEIIRSTWGGQKFSNIDIYYAFGSQIDRLLLERAAIRKYTGLFTSPVTDLEAEQHHDVILCGCADTVDLQEDCLLRKRLIAFKYLADNFDYDYIYTVCASSYVDQGELAKYVESVDGERVFHGPVGICAFTNLPYISGASLLLSMDIVRELTAHIRALIDENLSRYADDVAIGSWIARHISREPQEDIINNIKTGRRATSDNTFVMPAHYSLVDYVSASSKDQVRLQHAYHYHFNVDRMEQMMRFHRQFVQ